MHRLLIPAIASIVLAFVSFAPAQTTKPDDIDFRYAQQLYQKSLHGEALTEQERDYLDKAKAAIAAGHRPDAHRPDAQRPAPAHVEAADTAPAAGPFAVTKSIPIGGELLWGQITLDADSNHLYIPRTGKIQVLDIPSAKIIADIPTRGTVAALTLVPDLHRGFAINPRDNSLTIFDVKTSDVLGTLTIDNEPCCICYDAASKRLFIGCRGNSSLVPLDPNVDPKAGKLGPSIDLAGKPSSIVSDNQGSLYITLQDTSEVALVDAKESKLLTKWPLAQERGPGSLEGLSLDPDATRLFIGDRMMRLLVISTVDGRQIADVPIASGVQTTAFHDPYAFALTYDGALAILARDPQKTFKLEQLLPTGLSRNIPSPHTFALDEKNTTLYIPTIDLDTSSGAPRPVRDSFKILVVQKK